MPRKKPAKYPGPLTFTDSGNHSDSKPLSMRFRKSAMVGDIYIEMQVSDLMHSIRCWMPLRDTEIVKLQKWLARWRKSHETNWGPIEK